MRGTVRAGCAVAIVMGILMGGESHATLVAHWSFDNPADIGHDDSGNGHSATPYGDVQWQDSALHFDGQGDYLRAFDSTAERSYPFQTFSVHVRFRTTSQTSTDAVLITRNSEPGGSCSANFAIVQRGGQPGSVYGTYEFDWGGNVTVNSSPNAAINDGLWHTIDLIYDGSLLSIYRDGILDDETPGSPPGYLQYASAAVTIGSNDGVNYFFNGDIDDVRLYDHAVPEPASVSLIALGLLALRRTRWS